MATTRQPIFRAVGTMAMLLAIASHGEAQNVTFTATLSKNGTELSKAVTEPKAFRDDFPILRREGDKPSACLQETREVCLPAHCEIDFNRTYSTGNDPRGFGRGGPGYGAVVNSVITRDKEGWAVHQLDAVRKCLSSTVRVCSRRFFTGASYEGYHEIYAQCATSQPWKTTKTLSFTLPPGPYQHLTTLTDNDPPTGSPNGVPGTATIKTYGYTIDSKNPPDAPLLAGMFQGDPNVNGANGPQFWAQISNNVDLSVTGLEVTQGIQNLANRMPLVGLRQTAVRAYIQSQTNVGGVQARLRGYRVDGLAELPGSPLAPETEIQGQTTGGNRLRLNDSFLFRLPKEWTATGLVLFRLEVDPGDLFKENNETNNVYEDYFEFGPPVAVKVTSVPLHLHPNGDRTSPALVYTDTHSTFWPILASLLRFHPVSSLEYQDCGVDVLTPVGHDLLNREWDLRKGLDQALILTRVGLVRGLNGCGDPDMHWMGLVHPEINTTTGNFSTGGIAVPFGRSSWVKMRRNGSTSWASPTSSTLPHELGHNRGLFHPKCRGDEELPVTPLYPHPYPDCRLAKGEDGFFGFDVYHGLWGLPDPVVIGNEPVLPAPFENQVAFPFMGYKNPAWPDPFHYCRLLLSYGIPCNPLVMGSLFPASNEAGVFASLSGFGTAAPGLPAPAAKRQAAPIPRPFPREFFVVSGAFDAGTDTFAELDVRSLSRPPANALRLEVDGPDVSDEAEGDDGPELEILQLDGSGGVSNGPFRLKALDELPSVYSFLQMVPMQPGVTRIAIARGGKLVAEKRASANRPWVRVTNPSPAEDLLPGTRITWLAQDLDRDALTYDVYYSPDAGQTWRLLALGLTSRSYELPARIPGSSSALLRVDANDGFWTTSDETDLTYSVPESAPRAIILNPSGAAVALGATVTLTGLGTDLEQGPVTDPTRFVWTSNRDGILGSGQEVSTRTLSKGVHEIVLAVTDDSGRTGSASILLFVGIDPRQVSWTPWLDMDNPSGVGDFELLSNFVRQGACPAPFAIECRTTSGQGWVEAGQVYSCRADTGGVCVNSQQPAGNGCMDYEIRFLCPRIAS